MIEADRADHSQAKLDHDLIVPITRTELLHYIAELYSSCYAHDNCFHNE